MLDDLVHQIENVASTTAGLVASFSGCYRGQLNCAATSVAQYKVHTLYALWNGRRHKCGGQEHAPTGGGHQPRQRAGRRLTRFHVTSQKEPLLLATAIRHQDGDQRTEIISWYVCRKHEGVNLDARIGDVSRDQATLILPATSWITRVYLLRR